MSTICEAADKNVYIFWSHISVWVGPVLADQEIRVVTTYERGSGQVEAMHNWRNQSPICLQTNEANLDRYKQHESHRFESLHFRVCRSPEFRQQSIFSTLTIFAKVTLHEVA